MKAPGLGRLSFTIRDKGDHRELDVRAWWHPHGMPGLFYWLLMIPAHLLFFAAWRDASPARPSKSQAKTKIKRYSFMILIAYSGESRKNAHEILFWDSRLI